MEGSAKARGLPGRFSPGEERSEVRLKSVCAVRLQAAPVPWALPGERSAGSHFRHGQSRGRLFSSAVPKPNPSRMTTPANPSGSKPTGDDRNLVAVDATNAASLEERTQLFWERNQKLVWGLIIVVLLIIAGNAGWEYLQQEKDRDVQKAYAAAKTPEQLKSFAAANREHPLAVAAELTLADEAFTAGKGAEAVAGYDRVVAAAKTGPLAARAQLGRAVAKVQSGKAAEGAAELKQLADDANQIKAVRLEATYHLASLAAEAGNTAEALKQVEQLSKIENDFSNPWVRRGMILRFSLPPEAVATPAPEAAPAGAPAKSEETPKMQVTLPGKK